jgi:hypothetical protein
LFSWKSAEVSIVVAVWPNVLLEKPPAATIAINTIKRAGSFNTSSIWRWFLKSLALWFLAD